MTDARIALTTCPNRVDAKSLARTLVEDGAARYLEWLAASVAPAT